MADPAGFWKPLSVWHLRISDLNFATVSLPIFTLSLRSDISDWTFFLASATATKFLLRRSSKSVVCLKFMFSKKARKIDKIFTVNLTFTYEVRCFGGILYLPTLIRYFTTIYLVKSGTAYPTYLPKTLTSYVNAPLYSKCQIVNFCGLLRKHELCTPITSMA